MTGPFQHFRDAIWQAWQHKVASDLCKRKVFGVVLDLTFMAPINYLFLPILGKETKCCSEPFFPGEFGMASCLVKLRKKTFLVGSVVHLTMMVIFFWDCTFPPFVELRNQT